MEMTNKKHNSCVRVLEFLKLLIQSDVSLNNIYETNEEKFSNIEAHETFLKYINTLYISGLEIKKIGKKYSLSNSVSTVNISEEEMELLTKIYENYDYNCVDKNREQLDILFINISKFLPKEKREYLLNKINSFKIEKDSNSTSQRARIFQKYIDLNQKLKITCTNDSYQVEPKKIEIKGDIVYFIVYDIKKATIMKILTDDIQHIEVLPTRVKFLNITETVVFELYDRLSTNYRLRDCEHVQSFSEDKIVVVNCGEDKKLLLKRLLKYGENCKVILPKTFKKEFLNSLNAIASKLNGVKNEKNCFNSDR